MGWSIGWKWSSKRSKTKSASSAWLTKRKGPVPIGWLSAASSPRRSVSACEKTDTLPGMPMAPQRDASNCGNSTSQVLSSIASLRSQ